MPDKPSQSSGEDAARKLISLTDAASFSGLSSGHLRLLVSRGILWGTKIGRNWVTTREAVEEYLAQERHPGRKRK